MSIRFITLNLSAAGLIAAGTIALQSQMASAQNTYIMTCTPGGQMYNYTRSENGGRVATTVYFKGANQGASVQAPSPGQCTWLDRGLRGGEPEKLLVKGESGIVQASCNTRGCNVKTTAPMSSKILTAMTGNRPFQVHVYNDQNGHMRVVKFGP